MSGRTLRIVLALVVIATFGFASVASAIMEEGEMAFQQMDENADAMIDHQEYIKHCEAMGKTPEKFEEIDADMSGTLDKDEWNAHTKSQEVLKTE